MRSLLKIVHARGAIPNEMGPTRCGATLALTNQPTRSAPRPPDAFRQLVQEEDEEEVQEEDEEEDFVSVLKQEEERITSGKRTGKHS